MNPATKFSKSGGLTRPQLLEGKLFVGKEGGDLFQGGGACNFYIEGKLKSDIFNDKKL